MNCVTITAQDRDSNPVNVIINYDIFNVIWDRDAGTLTLLPKHLQGAGTDRRSGHGRRSTDGPAVEGTMIPQVRKIEEKE